MLPMGTEIISRHVLTFRTSVKPMPQRQSRSPFLRNELHRSTHSRTNGADRARQRERARSEQSMLVEIVSRHALTFCTLRSTPLRQSRFHFQERTATLPLESDYVAGVFLCVIPGRSQQAASRPTTPDSSLPLWRHQLAWSRAAVDGYTRPSSMATASRCTL